MWPMSAASFVGWHLIALAMSTGAPDASLPARYPCDGKMLTAQEIATRRGLSLETLQRLGKERSLQPAAVCIVPEGGLRRAVMRLEPAPDHPAEAIKHRL